MNENTKQKENITFLFFIKKKRNSQMFLFVFSSFFWKEKRTKNRTNSKKKKINLLLVALFPHFQHTYAHVVPTFVLCFCVKTKILFMSNLQWFIYFPFFFRLYNFRLLILIPTGYHQLKRNIYILVRKLIRRTVLSYIWIRCAGVKVYLLKIMLSNTQKNNEHYRKINKNQKLI